MYIVNANNYFSEDYTIGVIDGPNDTFIISFPSMAGIFYASDNCIPERIANAFVKADNFPFTYTQSPYSFGVSSEGRCKGEWTEQKIRNYLNANVRKIYKEMHNKIFEASYMAWFNSNAPMLMFPEAFEDEYKFFYIYDYCNKANGKFYQKYKRPIATVVVNTHEKTFGISICNPNDTFEKETGRKLAIKAMITRPNKIPYVRFEPNYTEWKSLINLKFKAFYAVTNVNGYQVNINNYLFYSVFEIIEKVGCKGILIE